MILDYNYLLDGSASAAGGITGVNVTAAVGSANSTNVIDLVNARDMGEVQDPIAMKIMVLVTTALTSTGAATFQVLAQGSTDNSAFTTYAETPAMIATSCTSGKMIANFDWPGILPNDGALPRYLRLRYTVGVSTVSAGAVISAIVLGRDMHPNRNYPSGVTISN